MAVPAKKAKDTRDVARRLSRNLHLDFRVVNQVITLLDQDNTVPFIARYRKEQTGGLEPTVLREIQVQCEEQRALITRAENVEKKIGDKITPEIRKSLSTAQTLDEIEDIYAPFKKGSKGTLADRARQLGLDEPAELLLKNPNTDLNKWINPQTKGLENLKEVTKGVQHVLAAIISKDTETLEKIRKLTEENPPVLECSLTRAAAKQKQNNQGDKTFEQYHDFKSSISSIKSHQVLAINRGEQTKVLSIKVSIPDKIKKQFLYWCKNHWIPKGASDKRKNFFQLVVDDAYHRLMEPLICRQARARLTKKAQRESTDIFGKNLLRLLLTPPVRGKVVLSIDPGFSHGCKLAMLGPTGEVLETAVIFPFGKKGNLKEARDTVKSLIQKHRCETIAMGNGVGCRKTETLISQLIKENTFKPLDVVYCIVSEDGASVYSASELAIAELPGLETSLRGAVSIGRRLQDPLVELVKIEPKHMGIGMYQHDIPEALLKGTLNGIVEDCVSFVGVDLNVAGVSMLRRIAGLNESRAKAIVAWRDENRKFINREQLKSIKGIGQKTYEQCAGFMRIMPSCRNQKEQEETPAFNENEHCVKPGSKRKAQRDLTVGGKKKMKNDCVLVPNYLDMTCIHPESYNVAKRFMKLVGACAEDIGQSEMKDVVASALKNQGIESFASKLDVGVPTLQLIADGLRQPTDYDLRASLDKPLFKRGLTAMEDLKRGMILTGRVANLTSFGAFVDCGVGRDGLIHNSKMGPNGSRIGLGDIVEVTVENVDLSKRHLSLRLNSLRSRLDPQVLTSSPFKETKKPSLPIKKNEGSAIASIILD